MNWPARPAIGIRYMPLKVKVYISTVILLGASVAAFQLFGWTCAQPLQFACYLLLGLCGARLRLVLPGVPGTTSVSFLFILVGIVGLSLPETLLLGCGITTLHCVWHSRQRPAFVQVAFNVATVAIATALAFYGYHGSHPLIGAPIALAIAAGLFFGVNTLPVAVVTSLRGRKPVLSVWRGSYLWSYPYYLAGAVVAESMRVATHYVGWESSLLVIPVAYLVFRSYGVYFGRLENEKKHAEEMASLHLRTIEALALAIEAKDQTTHDHLERVQVYAVEIGKELGLTSDQLNALRAAAVLHDIGKLAVPEHIISKPGKLTPEEFDKMKIHPLVGAEILERAQFPYPVAPIVRSHHERWDGSGYPDGLKGAEIPIGARILSVVDCLDALASDRQYRRALPLDRAMEEVAAQAGKSFDPQIVEILQGRRVELERIAKSRGANARLSIDLSVPNGLAPAAGFETTAITKPRPEGQFDFLESIAAARQEVQGLFELAQDLGNSLSLNETLSVLAVRLRRMIPCDAMAIYIKRKETLVPEYVIGDDFRLFGSLEIPMGEGLSGWVAQNGKWIVNGNPSVEPAYLNDPAKFSRLRSALAVPLEGVAGILGVLTLYRAEKDSFTKDHLRILLAICPKVALSIQNALRYRHAEDSATTDYLTGLPNARSLFLHLDAELARCKRLNSPIAVLVCDLDGFKQINDRFGHLEGNRVLHALAQGLKDSCREYDYMARMGGDEFVNILPGASPEAMKTRIRNLRSIALRAGREICGVDWLDMSVGRAFFPQDGDDAEQLLAAADRSMYMEKEQHKRRTAEQKAFWQTSLDAAVVQ